MTLTTSQIQAIAEQLDCGFRAFVHQQTGEAIFVPDESKHYDMDMSAWQDELDKIAANRKDYVEIDGMESRDFFGVMADFADAIKDPGLQNELNKALNKKHPFREFKFVIDRSGEHRQTWFDFKDKRYIEWVATQVETNQDSDL